MMIARQMTNAGAMQLGASTGTYLVHATGLQRKGSQSLRGENKSRICILKLDSEGRSRQLVMRTADCDVADRGD